MGSKDIPTIEDTSGLKGCVDLNWWIKLTQQSPRLEEIQHPDDRPTALFKRSDESKYEVRYQFGFIMPQEWNKMDPAPMLELSTS